MLNFAGYLLLTIIAIWALIQWAPRSGLDCQQLYAQQEQGISNDFAERCTQP